MALEKLIPWSEVPRFASKLLSALKSLPQEKLTAQQATKHLQKSGVSQDEILHTDIKEFLSDPNNANTTKTDLLNKYEENPLTLTSTPQSGGGGYSISDEVDWMGDAPQFNEHDTSVEIDRGYLSRWIDDGDDWDRDEDSAIISQVLDLEDSDAMGQVYDQFHRSLQSRGPTQQLADFVNTTPRQDFTDDAPAYWQDLDNSHSLQDFALERVESGDVPAQYRTSTTTDYNQRSHDNEDDAMQAMRESLEYDSDAPTGGGQFETYTTPGPKDNYQEIVTTMNDPVQRSALQPDGPYREPHYNDPNIVYHTRQSDRPLYNPQSSEPPTPIRMAEEVQSTGHADAREAGGYDTQATQDYLRNLAPEEFQVKSSQDGTAWPKYEVRSPQGHVVDRGRNATNMSDDTILQDYARMVTKDNQGYRSMTPTIKGAPPHLPYKNKYANLALNNLLQDAARDEMPGMFLPSGSDQVARYKSYFADKPKEAAGLRKYYDTQLPNELNKMVKKTGARLQPGRIVTENARPKDVFGREPMYQEPGPDGFTLRDFDTDLPVSTKRYDTEEDARAALSHMPRVDLQDVPMQLPAVPRVEQDLLGYKLVDPTTGKTAYHPEQLLQRTRPGSSSLSPHDPRRPKPEYQTLEEANSARRRYLEHISENTTKGKYLEFNPELLRKLQKGAPLGLLLGAGLSQLPATSPTAPLPQDPG